MSYQKPKFKYNRNQTNLGDFDEDEVSDDEEVSELPADE